MVQKKGSTSKLQLTGVKAKEATEDPYKNVIFMTEAKKSSIENQFLPPSNDNSLKSLKSKDKSQGSASLKEEVKMQKIFQVTKIDSLSNRTNDSLSMQSESMSLSMGDQNSFRPLANHYREQ